MEYFQGIESFGVSSLSLIGRREEMLKITQILLQSRKSNLILVGEPGVGKTGIFERYA